MGASLVGMQKREYMLVAALGVCLTALTAVAESAPTGQAIHRCIGAHGEIVFSGQACASGTATNAQSPSVDPTAPAAPTDACPTSREALSDRIRSAIARHDPNALGGLLRWRGVSASAANSRLRSLRDLVQRPLLAMDAGDNDDATGDASANTTGDAVRVRTGSNERDGVREHRFGVDVEGTCYWLVW